MRTILLTSTDPHFNLAVEEYFLANGSEDIRILWRNSRSVIIGKNQNTWAEVNVPYTRENDIAVVRRLSGGGAVFHDLGNVNYTFITAYEEGGGIDFARFTAPILDVLQSLGIPAALGGRNDIVADGVKISGNAQAVFRRSDGTARQLHHGTLLFGADLTTLAAALVVHPEKIRTKGIASVRSRVGNIRDFADFPKEIGVEAFMRLLGEKIGEGEPLSALTQAEEEAIRALVKEKYGTWEWNFGVSAKHETVYTARLTGGTLTASYTAQHGVLSEIRLYGDYFGTASAAELEAALVGARLEKQSLTQALSSASKEVGEYIAGCTAEEIADLILGEKQYNEENGEHHG